MKWSLGKLSFDALTLEKAAQKVILAAKKRNCTLVVTPNATMLHRASCDRELFALLQGAELVLPDGAGVILASRYLKTPYKPEKVAEEVSNALGGLGVIITDINDLGGNILGAYPSSIDCDLMVKILKDNPLGQSHEQTPMGIIRVAEE